MTVEHDQESPFGWVERTAARKYRPVHRDATGNDRRPREAFNARADAAAWLTDRSIPVRRKPQDGRNSFGYLRQLPSSRWQASYVGPDGERHKAPGTFSAKRDAEGWLVQQRASIERGEWRAADVERTEREAEHSRDTFGEYAREWIDHRVNRHGQPLTARTRAEYERLLTGPLDTFADTRLGMLTPKAVRTWYSAQLATGAKTQTGHAYQLMKSILTTALQDRHISENPCTIRGAASAKTGREVEPPTPAELKTILDTITPRYRAAVLIAAWGACRYGELTELRRRDVVRMDDGHYLVGIERAVTHTSGLGFVVGRPKSAAGVRTIALPPHVTADIDAHLAENVDPAPQSLLFPAASGGHLAQSTFTKHWYPARHAAGRDDMPFHALRHYGATRFAQTGATLREIQDRLGHSTVAAAMRYQHSVGRDAELARRMSELA